MTESKAARKARLKRLSNVRYRDRVNAGTVGQKVKRRTVKKPAVSTKSKAKKVKAIKGVVGNAEPATTQINNKVPKGLTPIKPGQILNPTGRPRGARSVFSDTFYKDLAKVWQEEGVGAMRKVAKHDPATFIRVAASLMPKQFKAELTDQRTLLVELIGAPEVDADEDLTSGGVMRSGPMSLPDTGETIEGELAPDPVPEPEPPPAAAQHAHTAVLMPNQRITAHPVARPPQARKVPKVQNVQNVQQAATSEDMPRMPQMVVENAGGE